MIILGIETSCDETSAALVEDGTKLLSLATATSQEMHRKYGGIIPDHAAREQLKSILPVIHECLLQAKNNGLKAIDAIAITVGPGLIGSLLIGVETAKTLSFAWNKPIVPVNHLIGHIYANWLTSGSLELSYPPREPELPALVLIVSGGHSDLVFMHDHGQFEVLGSTQDDAAGECFDKCGRLLGLPYPYGPFIEVEAAKFSSAGHHITLPRPLLKAKGFNFSFSGLKTAFLHAYQDGQKTSQTIEQFKAELAYELQEAVTDVLIQKFITAASLFSPKSLILCGGVAANKRLREKLYLQAKNYQLKASICIPPIKLCTDNAAYIASAAFYNFREGPPSSIDAQPGLTISGPAS